MKTLSIYLLIGCLMVGAGAGLFEKRCPDDEYSTPSNLLFEIVTWPGGIVAAMVNPTLQPCHPRKR